jgi:hypothetical protein
MDNSVSTAVRWGMLTIPISGFLILIGISMRGPAIDASVDPNAFALVASTASFAAAWRLIMFAQIVEVFSFVPLYAYLNSTERGPSRSALLGMVFSFLGGALFLALTGSLAFVAPVAAQLYLQGQKNVMDVANAGFFAGPVLSVLYPSGIIGAFGSVLLGIAMWRSGKVPQWAAILYALHVPLLAFPVTYASELLGAGFLFVSGVGIIWGLRRQVALKRATAPESVKA